MIEENATGLTRPECLSSVEAWLLLRETYLGNIWATRLSVFCRSTSSSSVLSLIRSSRLEEYCSSIRSIESMMLVFFPLVMLLNWGREPEGVRYTCEIWTEFVLYSTYLTKHNMVVYCKVYTVPHSSPVVAHNICHYQTLVIGLKEIQ